MDGSPWWVDRMAINYATTGSDYVNQIGLKTDQVPFQSLAANRTASIEEFRI
jgi:hypothetical protein